MPLKLVTTPAVEPVTLAEARLHLHLDASGDPAAHPDDLLVSALIKAAREQAEAFTRRAFIIQEWELYLDAWPKESFIRLPFPPLQSVAGVYCTDTDGNETELESQSYSVDTKSEPGRLVLKHGRSWPASTLAPDNPIRIPFTAGYGNSGSNVPESIKAGMKLLLGHLYEHRESVVVGVSAIEMPQSAEYLLWPYRVLGVVAI